MTLRSMDFESIASAIPPPELIYSTILAEIGDEINVI